MSIKLALGGDVNFSRSRGQIAGLVRREHVSFLARIRRKMRSQLPIRPAPNECLTYKIDKILLKDYGGIWKNPEVEVPEDKDDGVPFWRIRTFFQEAHICFVNLETPLSCGGRHIGSFCSSPRVARILAANNIHLVSIANNHSFDAGESGFLDTLQALKKNRIHYIGGGMNIQEARAGKIVKRKNLRLGFLSYTAICNSNFISLAKSDQPGILPLYEPLVMEDIARMRPKCDFLTIAPHFDLENTSHVHKSSIALARRLIDQGADLIVGSHSHVPKPIELYRGKLIIYSLGNLIFTYTSKDWGDNLVAQIVLSESGQYENARFFPIRGKNAFCFSPSIREDAEGNRLLDEIQKKSHGKFGTPLVRRDHYLEVPIPDSASPSYSGDF